jgi:predicted DNA-binding transcriptional regulator AlpA
MEALLNMDEAAALLKLTRDQMYELTRNRSRVRQAVPLPVVRIGKRKMFRASSLNDWITKLEQIETVQ